MTWVCHRVTGGVDCCTVNPGRAKRCSVCGKLRARRRPTVQSQIQGVAYERFVELNDGREVCGICGVRAKGSRRLHRDHCHRTARPRGLLCFQCNRLLGKLERGGKDVAWLAAAVEYLRRAQAA